MKTQVADRGHTLTWKQEPRPPLNHALAFEGTVEQQGAVGPVGRQGRRGSAAEPAA
ncbi:hypothetical protein ACWCY6_42595 [Streptomyces sp. 900105755]